MSEPRESGAAGLSGATIAGLLIASAQAPLGSTMIAVAIPAISHDLGQRIDVVTAMVVTAYLVVNIIAQSPSGKIGDLLGHARAVRAGILVYAAGAFAGVVAQGLAVIVASRCTMAIGGALCVPATVALLRIHIPRERHGRVFGMVGATMGLSAAIGPPLGGEIVSRFGWRGIFFAPLPFLGAALMLSRISKVAPPKVTTTPAALFRGFDWGGTALFAAGLVPLVVAPRLAGALRVASLVASVVFLVAFVARELVAKSPVLDPRLFTNKEFTAGSAVIALQNFSMYGLLFELPQFFQQLRGATPRAVGHVLFFMMVAMFATALVGGRLTDRLGTRTTALIGAVPMLGGMLWMQNIGAFMTPGDVVMPLVLLGVGLGLTGAPSQSAAVSTIPLEHAGMAAGATSTMRYLGGVLSILVLSLILGDGGAANVERHEMAARAFGLAAVAAAVACFALPRTRGALRTRAA